MLIYTTLYNYVCWTNLIFCFGLEIKNGTTRVRPVADHVQYTKSVEFIEFQA